MKEKFIYSDDEVLIGDKESVVAYLLDNLFHDDLREDSERLLAQYDLIWQIKYQFGDEGVVSVKFDDMSDAGVLEELGDRSQTLLDLINRGLLSVNS